LHKSRIKPIKIPEDSLYILFDDKDKRQFLSEGGPGILFSYNYPFYLGDLHLQEQYSYVHVPFSFLKTKRILTIKDLQKLLDPITTRAQVKDIEEGRVIRPKEKTLDHLKSIFIIKIDSTKKEATIFKVHKIFLISCG